MNRKTLRTLALSFCGLIAAHASAASLWYDNNGTAAGYGTATPGSWDGSVWATATGGLTATGNWTPGSSAIFVDTASAAYTVTVGADELLASGSPSVGVQNTAASVNVTIAQSGPAGDLDVPSGSNVGFYISSTSGTITVTAPIVGGGEVSQHSNGALALYGVNTFSGGMNMTGGQFTFYNNNSSFGTGNIILTGTGEALLNGGSAGVVIPNNITDATAYAINLATGPGTIAAPNTTFSGNFPLPTGTTNLETSGATNTVIEWSGKMSGSGNLEVSDKGTLILAGANTYSGTTLVTNAVNSGPATLVLGAAGTIASSSQLILTGGILNPDGINQSMPNTTLAVTGTAATATIDYGLGAAEIDFKNSSAVAWTSGDFLNLANWTFGTDALRFGTSSSGLTSAQLAEIEFNGAGLGTASLDVNGYVVVPEPASLSLLGLGAMSLLARRRK